MLKKLRPRSIYDVMAAIACCGVLAGGTAYAADTIRSSDIVDGEVKSVDIGNNEIGSGDVKDGSLNTFDVHSFIGEDVIDGTLTGTDVQNFSLGNGDFLTGSVDTRAATDNSLTGTDIDESTLNLPPTTTSRIAQGGSSGPLDLLTGTESASANLPAGNWVAVATVTATASRDAATGAGRGMVTCYLREGPSGGRVLGSGSEDSHLGVNETAGYALTVNAGATFGAGGGKLTLICSGSSLTRINHSQVLLMRVDSFI